MAEVLLMLIQFAYRGGECICIGRDGAVQPLCAHCSIPLPAHLGVKHQV